MRLNITLTAFTAFAAVVFENWQKSVLTKLTKPTILEALSSAVAYVEFDPVLLAGFFLGAISAIFSTVISALGFSGSSPQ